MKPSMLHFKKKGLLLLSAFVLLVSFNAAAQKKSVYDVIPGSGPKKTETSQNRPPVMNGDRRTNNERKSYKVHTRRRKHLPPGQAKKVYGGSAKDYAPGPVKKERGDNDRRNQEDHDQKKHGEKQEEHHRQNEQ